MQKAASLAYVLSPDDILPGCNSDAPVIYHSVGDTTLPALAERSDIRQALETKEGSLHFGPRQPDPCALVGECKRSADFALRRLFRGVQLNALRIDKVRTWSR